MADIETGAKWWFRYVIVPIIGGGGIVAIVVATIDHSKTVEPSHTSVAAPIGQSADTTAKPSGTAANNAQKPRGPVPNPPMEPKATDTSTAGIHSPNDQTPAHNVEPASLITVDPVQSLVITDDDTGKEYEGRNIFAPFGSYWDISWTIRPSTITGSLLLRMDAGYGSPSNTPVGPQGQHSYHCAKFDKGLDVKLQFIEAQDDGSQRILANVTVHCLPPN